MGIVETLKKYISKRVPQSQMNIFYLMFNGISAAFEYVEYKLNIRKRESNILTANYDSSLRSLAAENGYEPVCKIPAHGVAKVYVNPKLFSRVGYPLFLTPYAVFVNTNTGIEYYYDSDKALKIDSNNYLIPLVEGAVRSQTAQSTGQLIERVYIESPDVASDSVRVSVNGEEFTEVKSFFDNEGLYENRQFIVKFSENPQQPIVVYIKGTNLNDAIELSYRISVGELGNINYDTTFTTDGLIDNYGNEVTPDENELVVSNKSGFNLGSNGTTKDALRAAIGYNHGQNLLYDSVTYRTFINKFSNLMLQKIVLSESSKAINNLYVMKRQYFNIQAEDAIKQYKEIIRRKTYLLTATDRSNLNSILDVNSFCLSSHNLFDPDTNRFAVQILFETKDAIDKWAENLEQLLYQEFAEFLYNKDKVFDVRLFMSDYMKMNNVSFEYTLFNEADEQSKLTNRTTKETSYIIKHETWLPILDGNFTIVDTEFNPVQLFFDVNFASEETIQ